MRYLCNSTEMVCIGRIYKSGNLKGEEGIPVWVESDSKISYRSGGPDGKWLEYDPRTKKEEVIIVMQGNNQDTWRI